MNPLGRADTDLLEGMFWLIPKELCPDSQIWSGNLQCKRCNLITPQTALLRWNRSATWWLASYLLTSYWPCSLHIELKDLPRGERVGRGVVATWQIQCFIKMERVDNSLSFLCPGDRQAGAFWHALFLNSKFVNVCILAEMLNSILNLRNSCM